jgi:hypothetical protein
MDVDEFERLRRAVYGPHPDTDSLRRYEFLLAQQQEAEVTAPAEVLTAVGSPDGAEPHARRRRRLLLVALPVVLVLAAVSLVALQAVRTANTLPTALVAPDLAGSTLVAYGNQRSVAAGTGTRYEPFGYRVFQPSGGSLHVALRCVGTGTVVITAGQRFPFRCTGPERVLRIDDERAHLAPFVVTGATTGDVVWAVRITERPLPGSTATDPSKRLGDFG